MDAPCHTYILRALAGCSGKMVEELTGGKLARSAEVHLDPDLKASQLIDQRFTPPAASAVNPNSTCSRHRFQTTRRLVPLVRSI